MKCSSWVLNFKELDQKLKQSRNLNGSDVQECIMQGKTVSFDPPELEDNASAANKEMLMQLSNVIKREEQPEVKGLFAVIICLCVTLT